MRLIDAEPIEKAIAEWKERETNEPLTKTIVDNVGTLITHAPTIEAIPVSFIKKQIKERRKQEEWEFNNYGEYNQIAFAYSYLIENWRKENQ